MKKKEINRIIFISIALSVLAMITLQIFNVDMLSFEGFRMITPIFSGIVIFWAFYFAMGWKIPIINKLLYKNNLNGTWFGEYRSQDIKNDQEYDGEISLVIRQTFLNINVTSYTSNYLAYSFAESLLLNDDNKGNQLVYLYSQNEFNPIDETSRKGTSELHLTFDLKNEKLFGKFWTNHNTKGHMNVIKISKQHLKSFEKAKQKFKKGA